MRPIVRKHAPTRFSDPQLPDPLESPELERFIESMRLPGIDAGDVLQDAWIRVNRCAGFAHSTPEEQRKLLFVTARSIGIDLRRRAKADRRRMEGWRDMHPLMEMPEQGAWRERLFTAINNLPDDQRNVIVAIFFEKITLEAHSRVSGLTISRIRTLKIKSLQSLADLLGEDFSDFR